MSTTALSDSRRRTLGAAYPLLASMAWGVMYVVSKYSFGYIPPMTLSLVRVLVGGGALAALVLAQGARLPRGQELWGLLGLGVLVALGLGAQYAGTDLANASQGALITTLTPVFTVFFAWRLAHERLSGRMVLGCLAALAGVLMIVSPQLSGLAINSGRAALGSLLLLLGSLAWGLYTVAQKPLVRRRGALYVTAFSTLASAPFFALLAPWELATRPVTHVTPGLLLGVLYLCLGATSLAWYLWGKGVEYVDASLVAVFFFAQPVVGSLLGWLVLHEVLGWQFIAGGLIVSAGILCVSLPEKRLDTEGGM